MSTPSRAAIAVACSLTLALPARAAAADADEEESAGEASDTLSDRASEHVVKAIRAFNSGDYVNAESELKRAEFFAPKWRAIHFNLAVVAEAQGKLGTAIKAYEKFKPHATSDEEQLVDQRLFELNDRRKKIAKAYKSQIAVGAGAATIGVLALAAGGTMLALGLQKSKDTAEPVDGTSSSDSGPSRQTLMTGAYVGIVAGVLILGYSIIPLSKSVKAKRQLDGLALGPARLKWNGGVGATLRF